MGEARQSSEVMGLDPSDSSQRQLPRSKVMTVCTSNLYIFHCLVEVKSNEGIFMINSNVREHETRQSQALVVPRHRLCKGLNC